MRLAELPEDGISFCYTESFSRGGHALNELIELLPVDAVRITILVDNVIDVWMPHQLPATRLRDHGSAVQLETLIHEGRTVDDQPRAEHGFSALVSVSRGAAETHVLFDAGRTPDGLIHNMRCLGLDPRDIAAVVLSHGHFDHTTGMDGFIRAIGRANLPVIIHPHFWNRRRIVLPGREPWELPTTSRDALEDTGFDILERRQPSFLLDGGLLVTGEVDRTNDFEIGFPIQEAMSGGRWVPDPMVLDDQALVVNVRDHGLVVMTGCGHAGIVNTLDYVRRLTGISRVHGVIGGFHLNGPLFEPLIPRVCDAFAELDPDVIVPTHCTGWRAIHALAARFPDAFVPNSVGTTYAFGNPDESPG